MRIVAKVENGKQIRMVRWTHAGKKYALAYTPYPRLFGERLRRQRRALIRSMEVTMATVQMLERR